MQELRWAEDKVYPGMGHQFEDNLDCKYCKRQWVNHQRDPQKCNRYPDAVIIKTQETR